MKFFNKIFFFFFLLFSYSIFSQNSGYKTGVSNILNATNPEDIGVRTAVQVQEDKDDPLEYGYVNDKTRLIDLYWFAHCECLGHHLQSALNNELGDRAFAKEIGRS